MEKREHGVRSLKAELKKKLKESVQQAKNGKVRRVTSMELDEWELDLTEQLKKL